MNHTKRMFFITHLSLCSFYICLLYSVNFIYSKKQAPSFLTVFISWVPVISFVIIGLFFCFALFSDKYKKAQKSIYLNISCMLLSLIALFLLIPIYNLIGTLYINIAICVVLILNIVFHNLSINKLKGLNFDFDHEWEMLKRISIRYQKLNTNRWRKFINRIFYMIFLLCIIQIPLIAFVIIMLLLALLSIYPLINLYKEYSKLDLGINLWLIFLNYYFSMIASTASYKISPTLSMVLAFSCQFVLFILDNKISCKIYNNIEDLSK